MINNIILIILKDMQLN